MIVFDRLYERVAKLSKENAAIIADYVISMKTEINSLDYYRRDCMKNRRIEYLLI